MDPDRQALLRGALDGANAHLSGYGDAGALAGPASAAAAAAEAAARVLIARLRDVTLAPKRLEEQRIIAHDVTDPRSKSYDILRTQVLQAMDAKGWQVLAVTSPTPGCGKTLTSINLALGIARQVERSVLLADMDLRNPQVARRLGVRCDGGLLGLLQGQQSLADAAFRAHAGPHAMNVLPVEEPTDSSSEWMASSAMRQALQDMRAGFRGNTIILDLPPLLVSDDVIALLPQVDCVLLVTAVGQTTRSEVEECKGYLRSTSIVRVVVNKVAENNRKYYRA